VSWSDDPTAFAMYILVVGLVIGGLALRSLARGVDSRTWPTVEGRITSGSLDQDSDGGYFVRLAYEYVVEARTYTRREDVTLSFPRTRAKASGVLERYTVGGPVEVRYNPSKPSSAVVRPGVRWSTWLWLVIAFGTLLLGSGVLQGWVGST
jgi:uncharacterized protein DUF3592